MNVPFFPTTKRRSRMVEYQVEICYTEALVKRAARDFLVRFVRRDLLTGIAGGLAALVAWLYFGVGWYYAAALGGVGLFLAAVVVFAGMAYVRSALGKFRAAAKPQGDVAVR